MSHPSRSYRLVNTIFALWTLLARLSSFMGIFRFFRIILFGVFRLDVEFVHQDDRPLIGRQLCGKRKRIVHFNELHNLFPSVTADLLQIRAASANVATASSEETFIFDTQHRTTDAEAPSSPLADAGFDDDGWECSSIKPSLSS